MINTNPTPIELYETCSPRLRFLKFLILAARKVKKLLIFLFIVVRVLLNVVLTAISRNKLQNYKNLLLRSRSFPA